MSSTASIDKLELPNGIRNIGGRTTAGKYGMSALFKEAGTGTVTAAQTGVVSFTPTKTTGRYLIGGNVTLTSGTNTGTVSFVVNYVDTAGTTHTQDILGMIKADGTLVQSGTGSSTDWKVIPCEVSIDGSGTAISVDTTVTGSVNYVVCAYIMQLA